MALEDLPVPGVFVEKNADILSLIKKFIAFIALIFIIVIISNNIYRFLRKNYNISVNCWFCNKNSKVPYERNNSWICAFCGQYNGFTEDGDYNCEQPAFYNIDTNISSVRRDTKSNCNNINNFCTSCNNNQYLKVRKLAEFESQSEQSYDIELDEYKKNLEDIYGLCTSCQEKVDRILNDKKKLILGSKLAQEINKKKTSFNENYKKKNCNLTLKNRIHLRSFFSIILLYCAICCILDTLYGISISQQNLNCKFGFIMENLYWILENIGCSTKYGRSNMKYCPIEFIYKIIMYLRTNLFILFCTLGFNAKGLSRLIINLPAVLMNMGTLVSLFSITVVDNFKLNRFTLLLTIWSIYGVLQQLVDLVNLGVSSFVKIISSIASIYCIISQRSIENASECLDNTANSFHRIYSENYFEDKDEDDLFNRSFASLNSNETRSSTNYTDITKKNGYSGALEFENLINSKYNPIDSKRNMPKTTLLINLPGPTFNIHNGKEKNSTNSQISERDPRKIESRKMQNKDNNLSKNCYKFRGLACDPQMANNQIFCSNNMPRYSNLLSPSRLKNATNYCQYAYTQPNSHLSREFIEASNFEKNSKLCPVLQTDHMVCPGIQKSNNNNLAHWENMIDDSEGWSFSTGNGYAQSINTYNPPKSSIFYASFVNRQYQGYFNTGWDQFLNSNQIGCLKESDFVENNSSIAIK